MAGHRERDDERRSEPSRDEPSSDSHRHRHRSHHSDRHHSSSQSRSNSSRRPGQGHGHDRDRREDRNRREGRDRRREREQGHGHGSRSRSHHSHRHRSPSDAHESSNKRPRLDETRASIDAEASVSTIPSTADNTTTGLKRDDWMLPPNERSDAGSSGATNDMDFFSSLGTAKQKPVRLQQKEQANAESAAGKLHVSEREINLQFKQGKPLEEYDTPGSPTTTDTPEFGAPGHQWRMMKLRRVYERAEEERRPVTEVALEQYNGLAAFEQARAEKRWLDGDKSATKPSTANTEGPTTGIMLHDVSTSGTGNTPPTGMQRPGLFRKPGSSNLLRSRTSTPARNSPAPPPTPAQETPSSSRASSSQSYTPIPSVLPPVPPSRLGTAGQQGGAEKVQRLSPTDINKLRAKVMKAEMMGKPDAAQLRAEYDAACVASEGSGSQDGGDKGDGFFSLNREGHMQELHEEPDDPDQAVELRVLPTLDGQGRLYDVGPPNAHDEFQGNKRQKAKSLLPVHDPRTGEVVSYSAQDGKETLADLVRAERFTGGPDQGADAMLAQSISKDQSFHANAEYMDNNVDRLAARREKSALYKRNFAIQDFARVKKVLDECPFCLNQEGETSSSKRARATPISLGTRTYLTLPLREGLASIHVFIVPIDHTISMLELDDDGWDEVKNFMKCLIQLAHTRHEKMVFYETVLNVRWHKHTYLECVGVPSDLADDLPAYFREELLQIGSEWSQHKKIIPFSSTRPMRKSLVPNLPYFAVLFDYRGNSGMGHVIEPPDTDRGENDEQVKDGVEGLERGAFPGNFASELLGTLLDVEPRLWRRPKRLDGSAAKVRLDQFKRIWAPFDWTKMLDQA